MTTPPNLSSDTRQAFLVTTTMLQSTDNKELWEIYSKEREKISHDEVLHLALENLKNQRFITIRNTRLTDKHRQPANWQSIFHISLGTDPNAGVPLNHLKIPPLSNTVITKTVEFFSENPFDRIFSAHLTSQKVPFTTYVAARIETAGNKFTFMLKEN